MQIAPLIFTGIALGLGAAIPIGPVNVEIARRALAWGFRASAPLGLGAVTVDCLYATVACLGLRVAAQSKWVVVPLGVVGVALLALFGILALKQAWREGSTDWATSASGTPCPSIASSYVRGLLMTLTNPMTLVFWFASLPGSAGAAISQVTSTGGGQSATLWTAMGVTLGAAAWALGWAALVSGIGQYRRPWWVTATSAVGGITLIALAAHNAYRLISDFSR